MTSVKELQRKSAALPPVDTDVVLPAAIRAAANKAGQLHKDAYETPAPQQEQHGQERQQEEAKIVETPPAPKAGTEEVPVETPAKGEGYDGSWEQKFHSMKGRYDKQEDVIRQLTSELGGMRSEIERLRTSVATPAPTKENTFKKLTAEEREAYGEDFIDVSARAAEEKLMPEIETLKATVADLTGKLGQVAKASHDTQTLTMNQQLDRDLPDWKKINRDPRFIAWLNLRDPFSGAIRFNMLKEAHASGDAYRVLNFFNGFLRDEAVVDPAKRIEPEVTSQGKLSLESLAAPGRAKAPAAPTPPGDKETITRSQIKEFYALVNKGHYRGNEAEKADLERRIFEAERDGRVTN